MDREWVFVARRDATPTFSASAGFHMIVMVITISINDVDPLRFWVMDGYLEVTWSSLK